MVVFFSNNTDLLMNMIDMVDDAVLLHTQRVARWIYRTFGITNFAFARFCVQIGVLLRLFAIVCFIRAQTFNLDDVFLQIMMMCACAMSYFFVNNAERNARHGFANINRIDFKFQRMFWLSLSPGFAWAIFNPSEIINIDDLGDRIDGLSSLFAFFLSALFISVESEPPSESKLKKLIGAAKRMFSSSAVPQPA